MADKSLRAPAPGAGTSERERWEREVTTKLDNTTFTLDDAFRALLLTTGSTGQETEKSTRTNAILIAENRTLRGRITDLERKLRGLEVVAWL